MPESETKGTAPGVFESTIRNFSENLDALREFIDWVVTFLDSKKTEEVKTRMPDIIPFVLAMKKIDPEYLPEIPEEQLQRKIDPRIVIEVNRGDGEPTENAPTSVSIKGVPDEKIKKMEDALKKVMRTFGHEEFLYNGTLLILTSTVEWFLSQIFTLYFEKFSDAMGTDEKAFSLNDLRALGSIEDARKLLIESKVDGILRGSLDDWIKFLRRDVKLSMGYIDSPLPELEEVFQRRNLIVHNGGRVNATYLAKVSSELRQSVKTGTKLEASRSYLEKSIDLFEIYFLLIAVELWKKLASNDEERGDVLMEIAFRHLLAERWHIAERLSYFLVNDKGLPERDRLMGQMNYWQCVKWQGRYDEIRSDIERADFSAKEPIFRLAWHALTKQTKQFFELLPSVLDSKKLSHRDLDTWPIFREIRQESTYGEFREKNKEEFETTTDQTQDEEESQENTDDTKMVH